MYERTLVIHTRRGQKQQCNEGREFRQQANTTEAVSTGGVNIPQVSPHGQGS
jgi:hypothetical protein